MHTSVRILSPLSRPCSAKFHPQDGNKAPWNRALHLIERPYLKDFVSPSFSCFDSVFYAYLQIHTQKKKCRCSQSRHAILQFIQSHISCHSFPLPNPESRMVKKKTSSHSLAHTCSQRTLTFTDRMGILPGLIIQAEIFTAPHYIRPAEERKESDDGRW